MIKDKKHPPSEADRLKRLTAPKRELALTAVAGTVATVMVAASRASSDTASDHVSHP